MPCPLQRGFVAYLPLGVGATLGGFQTVLQEYIVSIRTRPWGWVQHTILDGSYLSDHSVSIRTRRWGRVQLELRTNFTLSGRRLSPGGGFGRAI